MKKLLVVAVVAGVAFTCDTSAVFAQHQHMTAETMMAEFEAEAERRRSEEGEHFDEEAYAFERSIMERRVELEEQRIAIDEAIMALDRELHEFFINRQREEMGNRLAEFEAEAERRRSEECEHFN